MQYDIQFKYIEYRVATIEAQSPEEAELLLKQLDEADLVRTGDILEVEEPQIYVVTEAI